ncbi:MAG: class I adenylate-forming enzyme family protein [Spirochaetia bacterium]
MSTSVTLDEAVCEVGEAKPDQEVLVCGPLRLINQQLLARIESLTRGLAGLGVHKGDRVAALLPPGPEFVYLFFAIARLGAVIVPLNPELRDQALSAILADAEPVALVAARTVDDETVRQIPSIRHVIAAGDGRGDTLGSLMAVGGDGRGAVLTFGQLEKPSPDNLFALLYTSGTTGRPKATMHTHRSLIAPVVATVKVRELWLRPSSLRTVVEMAKALTHYRTRLLRAVGKPQTIMSTTGWHTITGLHVMLQGLLMGDRLVAMPRFHPAEVLKIVEKERVTVLVAVPTAYMAMLALPDFARYDTSSLIVCAAGGSACPSPLAREIQKRFGCALYNGFGMTEAAGGISVSSLGDSADQQAETVGRPMPGIDVRIVDEGRKELPLGRVGELVIRGEGVMVGYYKAPELTAMVKDDKGWLYTGDLASMDEKGFLRIVGRSKDVIIRGGQNIYPAEIENFLGGHPSIAEVAVTGVPAAVGGESVWAFIRLKEGTEITVRDVLDFCRGRMETYKIPSQVRFLRELPRSELGKVQKFMLREAARKELEEGAL